MLRAWVIRGGDDGRLVDAFVEGGYIAVGYPDIPDGRRVDRYEVTERLRARGWTVPEARAETFAQFVHQMGPGHVVVLPDTRRREVVIGVVAGDYEFHADVDADDYRHRRPVRWLARHAADLLPSALRDVTRQRQTLTERSAPSLVEHAEAVERGDLGRDPLATSAPSTPRPARAPRAPRAAPPPKPSPPAERQCRECFTRKPLDLFPGGGDVCVDCA